MSYRRIKAKYDGKIAGLYDLEGTIGKGHYAVVKLARHVFTGEKVAVKVIDKTKLDEVSRAHLFQEVRCMKLVQHPNIVRLYEVIDTQSKLYLILELGDGGDLYDYIMKHDGGLEEHMAKIYFHQIVQAIAYCHQLHVVHRDLKPENVVFFDKTGSVKLTDFGFSNKFTPGRKLETSCGSLAYSAPEILLGDSYDPPAVDVWSLGVILFMLVCGKPPFQEANDGETLIKIMDCEYTIPSHVSVNCQHLIGKMLVREPSERISLDNILIHPWLNDGIVLPLPQRALVGRETLSDDEHSYIVQRIVDGKIASRDEIIHSLERNAYNHITATYYLLAERLLRKRNRASLEKGTSGSVSTLSPPNVLLPRPKSPDFITMEEHRLNLQKLLPDSPSAPSTPSSPAPPLPTAATPCPPPLLKRCSLIQEELAEEDEEMEVETAALIRSEEDFKKDERSNRARVDFGTEKSCQLSPSPLRASVGRSLCNVHSSPIVMNQTCEDDIKGLQKLMSKGERSHHKRHPIVVRGTSCSSSDTSDTDDIAVCQNPRRDKVRRTFQRRDSGDYLSDTNEGSALGGTASLTSRKDRSRDSSNEEKLQEKTRRLSCDMKRRLSIEEKMSSDLIREKRRNSVVGMVKKSVSLILGRAYVVGDNTPDITKLNTWNSCSDLSPNVRKAMNTGSLSMRHLADRTILGCILARELRISRSEFLKESETLDRENRPRSRVIHVRSNDFSELVDKFSTVADDKVSVAVPDTGLRQRSRGEGAFKMDINRNALNSLNQSGDRGDSGEKQTASTMKTKCCNLV